MGRELLGSAAAHDVFAEALGPPITIDIVELVVIGGARSQLDTDYVGKLAHGGRPLSPIIVHGPTKRVVDGVHRVRAAMLRDERQMTARLCFGDESELIALAIAANIAHGHPLGTADRKRAASEILAAHPDWSTRRIATTCGLAPGTVARLRGPVSPDEVRVGRNGHRRAVDSRDPRRLVTEVLAAEPGISLREAARKAGVSPTTVRNVRDRNRRPVGRWPESPLPVPPHQTTTHPTPTRPTTTGPTPRSTSSTRQAATSRSSARAVLDQLRTDPSLRHTVAGRRLLAGLSAGALDHCDLVQLARTLPTHCVELVAVVAADCSRAWQELADAIYSQTGNRHRDDDTAPGASRRAR